MKDAYAQAVFTLQWNQKTGQSRGIVSVQRCGNVSFVSRMETEMEPVSMQSEFYRELAVYDREHHTLYGRTVLCYLKNDCSATRTAAELGIHRNTVRNIISWWKNGMRFRWMIPKKKCVIFYRNRFRSI